MKYSGPRENKTEIEEDCFLSSTPTHISSGSPRVPSSPCRAVFGKRCYGEFDAFRTGYEQDTLHNGMDSDNEDWYEDEAVLLREEEARKLTRDLLYDDTVKYGVPAWAIPRKNTKLYAKFKNSVETKRLQLAIVKKLGGTASGPASPGYDRWSQGYAKTFELELKHRLRRATWGERQAPKEEPDCYIVEKCEHGCSWCFNKRV
jgi:hypothetical protein